MKRPLSIYIHIPFCVQKCAYCDFLSAPAAPVVQEQYLHMLMKEIQLKAPDYKAYTAETVFIGGGTPTVVNPDLMCRMIGVLKQCFSVSEDAEISMECNPGTTGYDALLKYRKAGVNRLSIGLQSTQDHLLKRLGRIHNYSQFLDTFHGARQAGFTNINIDLMSALPGQSLTDYETTLNHVLALKPEHISAYSLIVEEGTPFYDMELDVPDEDTERIMYERTGELLHKQGYLRYEISNYALEGYACKHNRVYWERGEYLGLGLGAASFLQGTRYKNQTSLPAYLAGDFSYEEQIALTKREAMEEFFYLGLRQMKGVSLEKFCRLFGKESLTDFEKAIEENVRDGLLIRYNERLFLTPRGIDVSNLVFGRFL